MSGHGTAAGARRAKGQEVEGLVAAWLAARGFTIVDRNYSVKQGELDLVCTEGDVVVFVEVRSREGGAFGSPAETVTPRKARRVVAAATHWAAAHGALGRELRFDVVAVTLGGAEPVVEHHRGAFDGTGHPGPF